MCVIESEWIQMDCVIHGFIFMCPSCIHDDPHEHDSFLLFISFLIHVFNIFNFFLVEIIVMIILGFLSREKEREKRKKLHIHDHDHKSIDE